MTDFKNNAVKAMVVLRKAFRTIDTKASESFREFDLTPAQFGVLDVLYAKGRMKVGDLIESTLATSGNMTVVIKNMEKKGWVTRQVCQSDGRAFWIELTADGRQVIENALPVHIEKVEEIFSVLSDEEQVLLINLLKKFKA
ncbi:MarR family winged helix-turn-helix transcriptional regulator [Streptococcus plurextorum]|uniref:MarR family winged helix-turn-helix transcriptional regulator n=1 Tax=Streptococcus plurextorum TaxID=456876 RepID=UPI000421F6FC|nr:MarR family transcriptional regulator [Streptococcus plurextorum]